jgi:cobalamin-dependent methionine synthase I
MAGMAVVGELFGAGKMVVVKSARARQGSALQLRSSFTGLIA